jgi:hypothetical protein
MKKITTLHKKTTPLITNLDIPKKHPKKTNIAIVNL